MVGTGNRIKYDTVNFFDFKTLIHNSRRNCAPIKYKLVNQ